jgi:hypothetical protein
MKEVVLVAVIAATYVAIRFIAGRLIARPNMAACSTYGVLIVGFFVAAGPATGGELAGMALLPFLIDLLRKKKADDKG